MKRKKFGIGHFGYYLSTSELFKLLQEGEIACSANKDNPPAILTKNNKGIVWKDTNLYPSLDKKFLGGKRVVLDDVWEYRRFMDKMYGDKFCHKHKMNKYFHQGEMWEICDGCLAEHDQCLERNKCRCVGVCNKK